MPIGSVTRIFIACSPSRKTSWDLRFFEELSFLARGSTALAQTPRRRSPRRARPLQRREMLLPTLIVEPGMILVGRQMRRIRRQSADLGGTAQGDLQRLFARL